MIKSEDKSNVWELDKYFTGIKITDVTNSIPLTQIHEQPAFDLHTSVNEMEGISKIHTESNAVDIMLTEDKSTEIGILREIYVDVSHDEENVSKSDLTVQWKRPTDTNSTHMVRMYHDEIVQVFGSYEAFFKNPTAIIDWVAAHVAKGTPSQW